MSKFYDEAFKQKVLMRIRPPENVSVNQLSKEYGITETTLFNWRKKSQKAGNAIPGDGQVAKHWSSADKFHIVIETYRKNELDLAEYCRSRSRIKKN